MNQTYVRTLENLGALPVMVPLHMSEATLRGIFERLDGLFLPGGEDVDPANYGAERHELLGATDKERDRAGTAFGGMGHGRGMPILGVCRGVQVINVACGGTLVQNMHSERPDLAKHDYFPPNFERSRVSHRVDIDAGSRLSGALGQVHEVNSMHHQGIDRIGFGLEVVARADDGLPEKHWRRRRCPTWLACNGIRKNWQRPISTAQISFTRLWVCPPVIGGRRSRRMGRIFPAGLPAPPRPAWRSGQPTVRRRRR